MLFTGFFTHSLRGLTWTSAISNLGKAAADWPKAMLDRRATRFIPAKIRTIIPTFSANGTKPNRTRGGASPAEYIADYTAFRRFARRDDGGFSPSCDGPDPKTEFRNRLELRLEAVGGCVHSLTGTNRRQYSLIGGGDSVHVVDDQHVNFAIRLSKIEGQAPAPQLTGVVGPHRIEMSNTTRGLRKKGSMTRATGRHARLVQQERLYFRPYLERSCASAISQFSVGLSMDSITKNFFWVFDGSSFSPS
jgi:hypothetical protein